MESGLAFNNEEAGAIHYFSPFIALLFLGSRFCLIPNSIRLCRFNLSLVSFRLKSSHLRSLFLVSLDLCFGELLRLFPSSFTLFTLWMSWCNSISEMLFILIEQQAKMCKENQRHRKWMSQEEKF